MPANKPNSITYKPTRPDTPMAWSVKRTNLSRPSIRKLPFMFACYPAFICAWVTYLMWDRIDEDPTSWLIACSSSIIAALLLLLIMLQKSVFHYRIHADHGEVEYQLYYPKLSGDFFIGFAVLILFMLMIITALTGSLLFLAGAASLAILPAIKLLKWEPPAAQHETSLPWIKHHFVTVDRKYLIIVVHTTDTTTGFKARFPNKELFEQYLAFLHTAVAPQAEFTEKVWEW